jgi:DNA-directed RNA polymerase subunit RPC12/RpoP
MKETKQPQIECKHCGHVYSIYDPVVIGGTLHEGTKVSLEVGCPECLEPEGIIVKSRPNVYPTLVLT